MKSRSTDRTPTTVNLTVKRRYLTEREVERLMDCARKHGRYGHRDATMILVAYRHGLRASEVRDLQWQQIELSEGRLHVHRVKNGIPSVHPIRGDEMRALRKLRREYPKESPKWRRTASRIFGANWRRQARDDFRFPLNHLGIRRRIALRNHLLDEFNALLELLIAHRLDAAGMLEFQLCRAYLLNVMLVGLRGVIPKEVLERSMNAHDDALPCGRSAIFKFGSFSSPPRLVLPARGGARL